MGFTQHEGNLGRHPADDRDPVVLDQVEHGARPPPLHEVGRRPHTELARELGHEADVGELCSGDRRPTPAPPAAHVGGRDGAQLLVGEHGTPGPPGGPRGEDHGHRPIRVPRQQQGMAASTRSSASTTSAASALDGDRLDVRHAAPLVVGGQHDVGLEDGHRLGSLGLGEPRLTPAVTAPSLARAR